MNDVQQSLLTVIWASWKPAMLLFCFPAFLNPTEIFIFHKIYSASALLFLVPNFLWQTAYRSSGMDFERVVEFASRFETIIDQNEWKSTVTRLARHIDRSLPNKTKRILFQKFDNFRIRYGKNCLTLSNLIELSWRSRIPSVRWWPWSWTWISGTCSFRKSIGLRGSTESPGVSRVASCSRSAASTETSSPTLTPPSNCSTFSTSWCNFSSSLAGSDRDIPFMESKCCSPFCRMDTEPNSSLRRRFSRESLGATFRDAWSSGNWSTKCTVFYPSIFSTR